MSTYLYGLARLAFRRRWIVLGVWLAAVVAAVVAAGASGGKTNDNFTVPGTESQRASDLLTAKLPALAGGQTQVVFATHGATKITDPSYRAGVAAAIANLHRVPQVVSASDPSPPRRSPPTSTWRSARCSSRPSRPTSRTPASTS